MSEWLLEEALKLARDAIDLVNILPGVSDEQYQSLARREAALRRAVGNGQWAVAEEVKTRCKAVVRTKQGVVHCHRRATNKGWCWQHYLSKEHRP